MTSSYISSLPPTTSALVLVADAYMGEFNGEANDKTARSGVKYCKLVTRPKSVAKPPVVERLPSVVGFSMSLAKFATKCTTKSSVSEKSKSVQSNAFLCYNQQNSGC
jgi:hypothetical protein